MYIIVLRVYTKYTNNAFNSPENEQLEETEAFRTRPGCQVLKRVDYYCFNIELVVSLVQGQHRDAYMGIFALKSVWL